MLKNFKQMLDFLSAGDMATLQQDLQNVSSLIIKGSKRIDDIIDESELFTINESDLDQRLEELDKEHFELSDKIFVTKRKLEKAREGLNKSLKELNEVAEVQKKPNMIFEVPDLEFDGRNILGSQQSNQLRQEVNFEIKDEVKSEVISQQKSQKWGKEKSDSESINPDELFDVEF